MAATPPPSLDSFLELARNRRAVRAFLPEPLPDGILDHLLEAARWAPSGYNLQPTHFVVVEDPALKEKLHKACFFQKQVLQAPATVVFTGDRGVFANHFEKVLAMDLAAGATSEKYAGRLRDLVALAFRRGPFGLGYLWKATLLPLASLFKPVPAMPAVNPRFWLTKQVMLAAMNFMLAAQAAGLGTVPMEGFDERRVRRALGIPRSQIVAVVIPVGRPAPGTLVKTRLEIKELAHRNGW